MSEESKGLQFEVDYDKNKLKVMTVYDIKGTEQDPQIVMELPLVSILAALAAAKFTPSWADKAINLIKSILDRAEK